MHLQKRGLKQIRIAYTRALLRRDFEHPHFHAWEAVYYNIDPELIPFEPKEICATRGCASVEMPPHRCVLCKVRFYCSRECQRR